MTYEEAIARFLEETDEMELIGMACQKAGWIIGIENVGEDDPVHGLVLGTNEWIDEHIEDVERFQFLAYESFDDDEAEMMN